MSSLSIPQSILNQLELEPLRLEKKFQMVHELKVEWLPNPSSKKSVFTY